MSHFLDPKLHNTTFTFCPFVYWWCISSISVLRWNSSWTNFFFFIKMQIRVCSLSNTDSNPELNFHIKTHQGNTVDSPCFTLRKPSRQKCVFSVKLTCIACVFCRFCSPSFRFWTWFFSCCLSSKLFSSSASRCFNSSLIFNSCCKNKRKNNKPLMLLWTN